MAPDLKLFTCHRLRATITERQCGLNRNGYRSKGLNVAPIISCKGCFGLGESAQIPLPKEEIVKKKKIECGRDGCGYGVKKEGDFCKKHQEPVTISEEKQQRGLDDGPLLPRKYASDLSSVITDAPVKNQDAEIVEHKSIDEATPEEWDSAAAAVRETSDLQISPVTLPDPEKQTDPCAESVSPLFRLLAVAVPPPPPMPPLFICGNSRRLPIFEVCRSGDQR